MRVTRQLLLFGMLLAPLGSSLSTIAYGQDESRGQGQAQGQGPGGGGRWQGRGGPGGPGGRMMGGMASLLGMEEVRKELKLDETQAKSLQTMREEMGGGRGGPGGPGGQGGPGGRAGRGGDGAGPGGPPSAEQMAEMADRMKKMRSDMESKIADILDPDQNARLLGLLIQREGGRALASKVLVSALELSPEQVTKLDDAQTSSMQENAKAMREAMAGGGGGPGGAGGPGGGWMKMREQMDAMNKKSEESMLAILTPEQRTLFDSMKGEKFDFPEGGRGGPGGPEGRGNRPGRGERPEIQ